MNNITINGVDRAMSAGEWCNEEFGTSGWDLNFDHILHGKPEYEFIFTEPKHAMLFALKWAHT
jgi:hypothetical protein